MKSFVRDLYDYAYTEEQAEKKDEESGDDEKIDIKLTREKNATNENNENVTEIDLCIHFFFFFFQIVLDLKKNAFH